ncbi:hypothetical protein ACQY0O_001150 [Thecaphora frezii]
MASKIANKVTRQLISNHAKQFEPEDPLYEFYTAPNGKQKRRKRALPPGLTKKQAKTLQKIKRRAHYLDKGFYICGFRFGWTFFIGLVPGLGDITDAILNYTLVVKPAKNEIEGIPDWLVRQMLFNNAVSAGIGLVPIVGDIALAAWRANSRNAKLVEECEYTLPSPDDGPPQPRNGRRQPDAAASPRPVSPNSVLRVQGEENMAKGLPNLTPRPAHDDAAAAQAAVQQHVQATSRGTQALLSADR